MDVKQLKYFVAVAEKLNFTEAAKSLYVAQSAVSQQIAELERKLGIPLFDRNRRSVKLTPAGHVLYTQATNLLKRFDEVKEVTKNAYLGYQGHLNIGYLGYGDRKWLPNILKEFQTKYPKVIVDINRYNQGEMIKALNEDNLDLVLTLSFGIPEQNKVGHHKNKIMTHHIYTESLCAVVAKDSEIAKEWHGRSIPLRELADQPFVVQNRHESPQGFDKTLQICSDNGFSPTIVNSPNSVQTVLVLVESKVGIAILPGSLEEYAGKNLSFIPIEMDKIHNDNEIVAAWKMTNDNPSLQHLISIIVEDKNRIYD
jgi:DNA-binding transcriptional LysR family regulator